MSDIRARTSVWKGLNRMPYIADGEMRDMKNLCSDAYPYLTTRKGRKPYKFDIYIPSPEGEAYRDIARLPEPCMDEMENVYKLTESYAEDEYISGEFYYYDAATKTWVQGIKDTNFLGETRTDIMYGGTQTLISTAYRDSFSNNTYVFYCSEYSYLAGMTNKGCTVYNPPGTCSYYITRDRVRYIGEDNGIFKKGKYYAYKVYAEVYWASSSGSYSEVSFLFSPSNASHYGNVYRYYNTAATTASISYNYIKPTGETSTETFTVRNGSLFTAVFRGYGYWEEIDVKEYEVVDSMPENPTDGQQVLYLGTYYGAPVESTYYACKYTLNTAGEELYFYTKATSATGYTSVTFLPEATKNNLGKIYRYSGIQKNGFAKCDYLNGEYKWVTVPHPKVKRTVTIAEYITDYKNIELDKILEIAAFEGEIAVIFTTKSGENKLLYNKQIYDVNNMTLEPGKKLSIAGNRLIVGESGAYIHIKDGATNFFKVGSAFSRTVYGEYAAYGNGGEKVRYSNIYGRVSSGESEFHLWTQSSADSEDASYKAVAAGLATPGTNFSVTFNGKTYYLTSKSAKYEKKVFEWGVGSRVYYDYGEYLQITATGVKEDFSWDNYDTGFGLGFTFASTDPHYYDVVAWKKRLWGYDKNVVHGTVSDIFAASGIVDWVTGNNTYLEAISQPIWQGGNITGLAALSNALILLKEDSLTMFTGNYPAIMSGSTIPCRGLNAENRESVAVGNESVFYLSQDGVYRFTGGIPQCISRDIKIKGTEAVGASDGNKYWLSLKEENGNYALYVYDANLGIWHKEDNTHVSSFTMLHGEMYMVDADSNEVYNINTQQEDVEWEMVLWFDEGTYKKKKYKELSFRGDVGKCELQIKYDDGEWQAIRWTEDKLQAKLIPCPCEEFMIKLKGCGICQIKSLDRVYEIIE